MKLLFVYDLLVEHEPYWNDGLSAALRELEKDWDIFYLNINNNPDWKETFRKQEAVADFVLGWGSTSSDHFLTLWAKAVAGRAGWCFGGGDLRDERLESFPVVFVENESYLTRPNYRLAFGTNINIFLPLPQEPKLIDALYPAAFAAWKHQEKFAEICSKEHLRGLAVGLIQKNNLEESLGLMDACVHNGVGVMDWVPAETLVYLYNMSKEVIITADLSGGCERAILEAKACGIPVRVVSDSQKLHDLNNLTPTQVRQDWNQYTYAKSLREGISECLKSS